MSRTYLDTLPYEIRDMVNHVLVVDSLWTYCDNCALAFEVFAPHYRDALRLNKHMPQAHALPNPADYLDKVCTRAQHINPQSRLRGPRKSPPRRRPPH
jgi:hypothetical protein